MPSPGAGTDAALQGGAQQLPVLSLSSHEAARELFGRCLPRTMLSLAQLGAGAGAARVPTPGVLEAAVRAGREARPRLGPAPSTASLFSVRKSEAPFYFFERTSGRKGESRRAGQAAWPRCCSFPPPLLLFFLLSRSTSAHPPLIGNESSKAASACPGMGSPSREGGIGKAKGMRRPPAPP